MTQKPSEPGVCPKCSGRGWVDDLAGHSTIDCPACKGSSRIPSPAVEARPEGESDAEVSLRATLYLLDRLRAIEADNELLKEERAQFADAIHATNDELCRGNLAEIAAKKLDAAALSASEARCERMRRDLKEAREIMAIGAPRWFDRLQRILGGAGIDDAADEAAALADDAAEQKEPAVEKPVQTRVYYRDVDAGLCDPAPPMTPNATAGGEKLLPEQIEDVRKHAQRFVDNFGDSYDDGGRYPEETRRAKTTLDIIVRLASQQAELKRADAEHLALFERAEKSEAELTRVRKALRRILEWDCLSPTPATHLLADLAWLKSHVEAALEGDPNR